MFSAGFLILSIFSFLPSSSNNFEFLFVRLPRHSEKVKPAITTCFAGVVNNWNKQYIFDTSPVVYKDFWLVAFEGLCSGTYICRPLVRNGWNFIIKPFWISDYSLSEFWPVRLLNKNIMCVAVFINYILM